MSRALPPEILVSLVFGRARALTFFFFNVYLFILRDRAQGEGQGERGRESQAGSSRSVQSPTQSLNSHTVRSKPDLS